MKPPSHIMSSSSLATGGSNGRKTLSSAQFASHIDIALSVVCKCLGTGLLPACVKVSVK